MAVIETFYDAATNLEEFEERRASAVEALEKQSDKQPDETPETNE